MEQIAYTTLKVTFVAVLLMISNLILFLCVESMVSSAWEDGFKRGLEIGNIQGQNNDKN